MLVSGTMSDNETTSSFPDRLVELSAAPSAHKLTQTTNNQWYALIKQIYATVLL